MKSTNMVVANAMAAVKNASKVDKGAIASALPSFAKVTGGIRLFDHWTGTYVLMKAKVSPYENDNKYEKEMLDLERRGFEADHDSYVDKTGEIVLRIPESSPLFKKVVK